MSVLQMGSKHSVNPVFSIVLTLYLCKFFPVQTYNIPILMFIVLILDLRFCPFESVIYIDYTKNKAVSSRIANSIEILTNIEYRRLYCLFFVQGLLKVFYIGQGCIVNDSITIGLVFDLGN